MRNLHCKMGGSRSHDGVWITKTRRGTKITKREVREDVRTAARPFVFFVLRGLRRLSGFVIQTLAPS